MSSAGFEQAIQAREQLQTKTLDRTVTGMGSKIFNMVNSRLSVIVVKITGGIYHCLKIQLVNVWYICSHDDIVGRAVGGYHGTALADMQIKICTRVLVVRASAH